eukprot:scaffold4901_cov105-Cylindrotheca_fusiformis.AAC.6
MGWMLGCFYNRALPPDEADLTGRSEHCWWGMCGWFVGSCQPSVSLVQFSRKLAVVGTKRLVSLGMAHASQSNFRGNAMGMVLIQMAVHWTSWTGSGGIDRYSLPELIF